MSSTKCPNCGKKLTRDFCMYCGYMTSGIFIDVKKPKKIRDIEVYLDNRYDKMNRNKNSFVPFFLGPLYFFYNKFLLFGLLAMLFDFLFCKVMFFLFYETFFNLLFSLLILRMIYATVANMICLWLFNIKIKLMKKIYKDKYLDYLRKSSKDTTSFLFIILGLVFVATIFVLYIESKNKTI